MSLRFDEAVSLQGMWSDAEGQKPAALVEAEESFHAQQRTASLLLDLEAAGLIMDEDGLVRRPSPEKEEAEVTSMKAKVAAARSAEWESGLALLNEMARARPPDIGLSPSQALLNDEEDAARGERRVDAEVDDQQ